ncbi:MAG: transcription antitermination factor NusB [Proteobacteria bacterium]|nr:transcription antitermination factor NusB [Pseudomonadota bacterium]
MTDQPAAKPDRPRPSAEARSNARLAAVQALYAIEIAGDDPESLIRDWPARPHADPEGDEADADANAPAPPLDRTFMADVVRRAHAERAELARHIREALGHDGAVERTEALLRAIMTAGAFELAQRFDVPARVVIDEYVRVARSFYDGGEPALINAVLDRVARAVRPFEMSGVGRAPKATP